MTHLHETVSEPAQFLVENVALLPKGRVLDIAMGNGRNAIYLARMGFAVEGVDISPEAVNGALEAARKTDVAIKAEVADLRVITALRKAPTTSSAASTIGSAR